MSALQRLVSHYPASPPPSRAEIRRNDWVLLAFVGICLLIGAVVGYLSMNQHRTASLGQGLPEVRVPTSWALSQSSADGPLIARNPRANSLFKSTIQLHSLPVSGQESLDTLRARNALQRSTSLDFYRELSSERLQMIDNEPALLTTYVSVEDPGRQSGALALPVVVQSQDLLFRHEGQWYLATSSADATIFADEERAFNQALASLGLRRSAP
jgi:hypothetical protein